MTQLRYVVGEAGQLAAMSTEPTVQGNTAAWGGGWLFTVRRGVLGEYKSLPGRQVYARQIPEPQLVHLSLIHAQLRELRTKISELEAEEQSVLLTAARNGQRVRVEDK